MDLDWDKLRVFHAVAEAGSFTRAGEALGLSQSAVSRQVSTLEQSLNTLLFHRHARGILLTGQGEALFRTAADVAEKIALAETRCVPLTQASLLDLAGPLWPGLFLSLRHRLRYKAAIDLGRRITMISRPIAAGFAVATLLFLAAAAPTPAWAQNADEDWDRMAIAGVKAYGLNQIPAALENLEAAMKIADDNFAEDDRRLLNSLLNLAPLYSTLERYEEAVELAERAVAIQEAAEGPNNPNLMSSLPILAGIYRDLERHDEAITTAARGADLMDLMLGELDPRALTVREELAVALFRAGRLEDSLAMFERILPLWEQSLGPEHIRLAMSLSAYAGLLRDLGREADAQAADEIIATIRQAWDAR